MKTTFTIGSITNGNITMSNISMSVENSITELKAIDDEFIRMMKVMKSEGLIDDKSSTVDELTRRIKGYALDCDGMSQEIDRLKRVNELLTRKNDSLKCVNMTLANNLKGWTEL